MSNGSISLELNGFDELATLWQQAPEIVQREMIAAAEESAMLLQREVVERTPKGASGLLGSSVLAHPVTFFEGDVISLTGTSLSYAVPVELGTKPHFPPLQPLVEWAEVVLGLEGKEAQSAAFAIARKISRQGTEGKFMFRDAFASADGFIKNRFSQAMVNIRQALATR